MFLLPHYHLWLLLCGAFAIIIIMWCIGMYTEPGTTAKQSNVLALSTTLSRYAAVDIQETETSAHVCTQHLQMYCNVHCQSQNISLPQPFVRVVIMFVRHPILVCVLLAGQERTAQKVSSIQYHCSPLDCSADVQISMSASLLVSVNTAAITREDHFSAYALMDLF